MHTTTRSASLYIALAASMVACGASRAGDTPGGYASTSLASYGYATSGGAASSDDSSAVAMSAPVTSESVAVRAASPQSAPSRAMGASDSVAAMPTGATGGAVAPVMVPGNTALTTITTTTTVQMQVPTVIEQQTTAGLLTAATVGDHDRRSAFLEYLGRHPVERSMLRLDMSRRVRFRLTDGQGQPVNDAVISLAGSGAQITGRSHADGIWDLYPNLYRERAGPAVDRARDARRARALVVALRHHGSGLSDLIPCARAMARLSKRSGRALST